LYSKSHEVVGTENFDILIGLLFIANTKLELLIRDQLEHEVEMLSVVYENELLPMLEVGLGPNHPYWMITNGYSGIAHVVLGHEERGRVLIQDSMASLTSNVFRKQTPPIDHPWILRLKKFLR
jgi:hypothetical protein